MVSVLLQSTHTVSVFVLGLNYKAIFFVDSAEMLHYLLAHISSFACHITSSVFGQLVMNSFLVVSQISTGIFTIKPQNLIYYVKGDFPPGYFLTGFQHCLFCSPSVEPTVTVVEYSQLDPSCLEVSHSCWQWSFFRPVQAKDCPILNF